MILLDDREDARILPTSRTRKFCNIFPRGSFRIKRMEFGDFAFEGSGPGDLPITIGVERKTVSDLLSSINTGRLVTHQLPGLEDHYDRVYVVVEGEMFTMGQTGILARAIYRKGKRPSYAPLKFAGKMVTRSSVEGFLFSVEEFWGFRVLRTKDRVATADLIMLLEKWWGKKYSTHRTHRDFNSNLRLMETSRVRPNQMMKLVASVDGIGPDRAYEAAKGFYHFGAMVGASRGELAKLPKWGKVTARKFTDAVLGEGNGYYVEKKRGKR